MTTINNGGIAAKIQTSTAFASEAESLRTGAAGKAAPGTAIVAVKGMLAALATNYAARAAGVSADGVPALALPKADLANAKELKSALNREVGFLKSDPAYAARADQFFAQLEQEAVSSEIRADKAEPVKTGDEFDINNMKSFSPLELIMLLLHLLNTLRNTDAALNAKMTLGAADAVGRTVASIEKQGYDSMVGAITGASISGAFSIAGVGMKAVSSKKTFQNAKQNGAAINDSKAETQKLNTALNGVKPGTPGAEVKELKLKKPGANGDKTVNVDDSNKTLDAADKKVIENRINGDQLDILAERETASAANIHGANKLSMAGDVFTAIGMGVGTMSNGITQSAIKTSQASEQVSNLDKEVTGKTRDEAGERTQSTNAKAGELVALLKQLAELITGSASTVAGNTRV